ncbi:hypothetical protein [Streptomyces toxytricini]|uniref:hypothetical protein n=1 Tax=Streptomyces toxytricini TaxID=67369 RepID=UPI00343ADCCF
MSSQARSAGSVEEQVSIIDNLIGLPFPEGEARTPHGWGGPGHLIAVLRESRDFWDAPDVEAVTVAEEELEADLAALVALLAARWGRPAVVDLWPCLGLDDFDQPGVEAPEPLGSLCNLAGSLHAWRLPSTGRWLGLTIGQADREFPLQLLAAVGEAATLPDPS